MELVKINDKFFIKVVLDQQETILLPVYYDYVSVKIAMKNDGLKKAKQLNKKDDGNFEFLVNGKFCVKYKDGKLIYNVKYNANRGTGL